MSASSQKEREGEKEYATTSTLYILTGVVSVSASGYILWHWLFSPPVDEVRRVWSLSLREYVHCISFSSFWSPTHNFTNSKYNCSVFNHRSKDTTASNSNWHSYWWDVPHMISNSGQCKPNYRFHLFYSVVCSDDFVYTVYLLIIYCEIWFALHFFRALKKPKITNSVNQFHERLLNCYVWYCDW